MSIYRFFRSLAAVALLTGFITAPAHATPPDERRPSIIASFEGRSIRLADGWGEARACSTDGMTTRCYRTEAAMDAAEGTSDLEQPTSTRLFVECSAPALRLYSGASYGGSVLQLTTRFVLHNLSPLGFNNITSSYQVGACSATFFDTTTGGTVYPGSTAAGVSAPSMAPGWDNRVGSVYIF